MRTDLELTHFADSCISSHLIALSHYSSCRRRVHSAELSYLGLTTSSLNISLSLSLSISNRLHLLRGKNFLPIEYRQYDGTSLYLIIPNAKPTSVEEQQSPRRRSTAGREKQGKGRQGKARQAAAANFLLYEVKNSSLLNSCARPATLPLVVRPTIYPGWLTFIQYGTVRVRVWTTLLIMVPG